MYFVCHLLLGYLEYQGKEHFHASYCKALREMDGRVACHIAGCPGSNNIVKCIGAWHR